MYSAQIMPLAALQALPVHPHTTTHTTTLPLQTAKSFTQDTQDKHSLVNWQDSPNYSVITQVQTR